MRKRGNICSHTSARSAAHWLSSRALFSGVRGKRNKSNVRRILLSRSDDTRHWAMILSPSFARRRGARKESAMPLMQAVRTSDSSVCFKHCIFRKTLQTRWLSVYCVLRFFSFFVSASASRVPAEANARFAAASGARCPSSALTRGDKVEGQRYAWSCVSTRGNLQLLGGQKSCWHGMMCLTLLCSQRCEVFAFGLMAQCPCHEEAESTVRSGQLQVAAADSSGCRAQKCCIGGINNGVGRLLRWHAHLLLPMRDLDRVLRLEQK
jgi:hypothetical protein